MTDTIFVRSIPYDASEEDFKQFFLKKTVSQKMMMM